jgi:hypothetical protein
VTTGDRLYLIRSRAVTICAYWSSCSSTTTTGSLIISLLFFFFYHHHHHHRYHHCTSCLRGDVALKHCSLFKCTFVLNSVLFWKLSVFEFLLGIHTREPFMFNVCSSRKTAFLLCVFQLLVVSVGTLTYLEPQLFLN